MVVMGRIVRVSESLKKSPKRRQRSPPAFPQASKWFELGVVCIRCRPFDGGCLSCGFERIQIFVDEKGDMIVVKDEVAMISLLSIKRLVISLDAAKL